MLQIGIEAALGATSRIFSSEDLYYSKYDLKVTARVKFQVFDVNPPTTTGEMSINCSTGAKPSARRTGEGNDRKSEQTALGVFSETLGPLLKDV